MLRQSCCHPQLSRHNQMGGSSAERLSLPQLYEMLLGNTEQKLFSLLLAACREVVRWAERRAQA